MEFNCLEVSRKQACDWNIAWHSLVETKCSRAQPNNTECCHRSITRPPCRPSTPQLPRKLWQLRKVDQAASAGARRPRRRRPRHRRQVHLSLLIYLLTHLTRLICTQGCSTRHTTHITHTTGARPIIWGIPWSHPDPGCYSRCQELCQTRRRNTSLTTWWRDTPGKER